MKLFFVRGSSNEYPQLVFMENLTKPSFIYHQIPNLPVSLYLAIFRSCDLLSTPALPRDIHLQPPPWSCILRRVFSLPQKCLPQCGYGPVYQTVQYLTGRTSVSDCTVSYRLDQCIRLYSILEVGPVYQTVQYLTGRTSVSDCTVSYR